MIYAYIDEQRVTVPVVRLCHALGVSTSEYYVGRTRGPSRRTRANEALLVHLRAIRVETHETYGSPRMHVELVERDQPCIVNRVARLMRLYHLAARHKRPYHPKTTCPDSTRPVAPNRLAQDFTTEAPNRKWLGDTLAPRCAQRKCRCHVYPDESRLAVSGRSARSVFAPHCRLGSRADDDDGPGAGRAGHGLGTSPARREPVASY